MIEIEGLCIQQGEFALHNVNLCVKPNRYGVLMGRSGSGKTSLMEVICGLRPLKSGGIKLAGVDVTRRRPGERSIGYVPQDGALFPTMSVRDQVGFGMRVRLADPKRIRSRVDELSKLLGITHLLDRRPKGLSGGETQRVAIGRALSAGPSILCLDEPLSALDDVARNEMIGLLKDLHREMPVTTLHITHHLTEARELADDVFILEDGKLSQQQ